MTMRTAVVLALLLVPAVAAADPAPIEWNLPSEVGDRIKDQLVDNDLDGAINPYYLRADFDGDKRADYVIAMKRKRDGEARMLVVRGKKKSAPIWLDDADGLSTPSRDGWYIHDRAIKVEGGAEGGKPPKLKGDALLVYKAESSSSLVYWDGKRFRSYWQGD